MSVSGFSGFSSQRSQIVNDLFFLFDFVTVSVMLLLSSVIWYKNVQDVIWFRLSSLNKFQGELY